MDLISVIIPVYNVERYLKECVDSVLNQSYSNLEIILVDDGSTDDSPQICDAYASLDPRVKVLHKMNGGVASARNSALDICKGSYIYLLDSDDYVVSDCIEKMHQRIVSDGSSMCICNYRNLENGVISKTSAIDIEDTVMTGEEYRTYFYGHVSFAAQTAFRMYSADVFKDIRYPNLKCGEDAYVMLWIMNKTERISVMSEALGIYRRAENSITYSAQNNYYKVVDVENQWWNLHIEYYTKKNDRKFLIQALRAYCHIMLIMWDSITLQQKKTYAPVVRERCRILLRSKQVKGKAKFKYMCCMLSVSLCAKVSKLF